MGDGSRIGDVLKNIGGESPSEPAFRRGFHHAASAAYELARSQGASEAVLAAMAKWENSVAHWRTDHGSSEPPRQ